MRSQKSTPPPKVIYSPPTRQELDAYVRRVCKTLGGEYNEPAFRDGFAAHVKLTARIQARFLNQKNQQQEGFDNAE